MNRKRIYLIISMLIFLIICIWKPLNLNLNQSIILASTIIIILWWSTNIISKSLSSIIIILIYFIFSRSDARTILKFPLSNNLILIISSYLIAHGIRVSGLADRISRAIISRYAKSNISLIILSFVLSFMLIFLIPQTFPRAIILSSIYLEFLKGQNVSIRERSIILFSVFVAVTGTSMAFINGDVIFNNAAIQFASVKLTYIDWAKYMLVPSIIISALMFVLFIITFYKDIKGSKFLSNYNKNNKIKFTVTEKKASIITIFIIILWSTESFHTINAAWVSLLGVIAMIIFGLVKFKDYKIIKPELLLFLTAAFSIGGVLNDEGIASMIFNRILPSTNNDGKLIFYSIIVVMILHMVLGSSMASMSICMPVMVSSIPDSFNPIIMMFIIYTAINIHYLLPIHHVVIMIGEGEGHYDASMTVKYGAFLTVLVFVSIYLILIPFWKLFGLYK